MVWRAGGGAPMRRCISSTGNLHSYSYPSTDGSTSGASGASSGVSGGGGGGGHSPIPIWRAGTPPVMGMAGLSTSPGSLHAFHSVMTPPMNSPRGGQLLPMAPFERTWGDDVVRVVCISGRSVVWCGVVLAWRAWAWTMDGFEKNSRAASPRLASAHLSTPTHLPTPQTRTAGTTRCCGRGCCPRGTCLSTRGTSRRRAQGPRSRTSATSSR